MPNLHNRYKSAERKIWFCGFKGEDLNVIFYQNMPNLHNRYKFISNRFKLYFVNFVLNKENIFLGCKDESLLLNLLIILTKNYIYKCKLNEAKTAPPSIQDGCCY
jgi:hypothetical protein